MTAGKSSQQSRLFLGIPFLSPVLGFVGLTIWVKAALYGDYSGDYNAVYWVVGFLLLLSSAFLAYWGTTGKSKKICGRVYEGLGLSLFTAAIVLDLNFWGQFVPLAIPAGFLILVGALFEFK